MKFILNMEGQLDDSQDKFCSHFRQKHRQGEAVSRYTQHCLLNPI
uniref:Uncharacterized protein n=1 Tax=Anguilla anguilla TaxID=7936 RepID=A0A0E9PP60_ANGAN